MPCDYRLYPSNWKELREKVLKRANQRCEGSPKYPDCRAENYAPHPETGAAVVLTVAHLDHDATNNNMSNLRAWCQRCHNAYDAAYRANNRRRKSGGR